MTRIAQIGLGNWGSRILKTLSRQPGVELVWTAGNRDWPDKLASNAAKTDGVVLAVPPTVQPMIALQCLREGLAVFLEKPLALNAIDAKRIHDEAAMRGLPVVVDHVWLFHPLWQEMKRRVAGRGEDFKYVEFWSGGNGPQRNWGVEHAALWDWGPHDVAMALDLMNGEPPNSVSAKNTIASSSDGIYHLKLEYDRVESGAIFVSTGNKREGRVRKVNVGTEHGLWTFADNALIAPISTELLHDIDTRQPLDIALRVWLDAVNGAGWDDRVGTTLALKVVRILEEAAEKLSGRNE